MKVIGKVPAERAALDLGYLAYKANHSFFKRQFPNSKLQREWETGYAEASYDEINDQLKYW